ARPGLATAAAAARPVGCAQVQLAGETRRVLVVLDARDHGVRTTVALVLGPRGALVRAGRRLGMAVGAGLALGRLVLGRRRRRGLGFLAQALGLGLFLALALGGLFGATPVLFGQALLLGQVALARFLELAQDLRLLVVHRAGLRRAGVGLGRLDQGDLLAHHHVDGRLVAAAPNGELLLAGPAERDLLRRGHFGRLAGLAVRPAQEAEQLDLLGAG